MMTSTTLHGYYLGDGVAVCDEHYDPDLHGRPGTEGVYPIYSHEDDGSGLSCDVDGDWIFEPYPDGDDDFDVAGFRVGHDGTDAYNDGFTPHE
jgi:hypothetical protein